MEESYYENFIIKGGCANFDLVGSSSDCSQLNN